MNCSFCGKSISKFSANTINIGGSVFYVCDKCAANWAQIKRKTASRESLQASCEYLDSIKNSGFLKPQIIGIYTAELESARSYLDAEAAREAEAQQPTGEKVLVGKAKAIRVKQLCDNMILTTCPYVEGYEVTRQLGLVFGEIAFKTGFFKSLGATLNDFGDMISFGDRELSGTAKLLDNSREYALTKLKRAAAIRDANAIVGIDAETTIGEGILHVTIYGTAVYIEKLD